MYEYKVTRVTFNDGTVIHPGKLTVIVGPNNAGKSRALKEIAAIAKTALSVDTKVVKDVGWSTPNDLRELREAYDVERYRNENGEWVYRTLSADLVSEFALTLSRDVDWPRAYEVVFSEPAERNRQWFAQNFADAVIAFLTTESRLQLVKESASAAHERQSANLLQALFNAGTPTEKAVRQLVNEAFGRDIALDFTNLQKLLLRVGHDFSALPPDPRDARPFMLEQEKLDEQGDGLRSFVGIVIALLSLKRGLYLIDEPEAFLHPPHAFKIGDFLATQVANKGQIVLATHSADVVRGILSKTGDVSILRIDRSGNTNRFMMLDPDRLKEIVNDPLLSSARVLDGLFYSGAVVVESDSDARFYHAVSNRIKPDADLHFVNADNKQTVPRIATLYRDIGVRCAGIVDFDVLNDRTEFQKQLTALELEEEETKRALAIQEEIAKAAKEIPPDERLENVRLKMNDLLTAANEIQGRSFASEGEAVEAKQRLLRQIESRSRELADSTKGWRKFKEQGRAALPVELQNTFDTLAQVCAKKGLHINPCGELESMLVEQGKPYTTNKAEWIRTALQLLANLSVNLEMYPWKFIKGIHEQLLDQERDLKRGAEISKSPEPGESAAVQPAQVSRTP